QGLCMFDAQQKLIICNKRYAELYDIPAELTVRGTPVRAVLAHLARSSREGREDPEAFINARLKAVADNERWYAVNQLRDGRIVSVSRCRLPNGGWIATHEDITERRNAEAKIEFLAH